MADLRFVMSACAYSEVSLTVGVEQVDVGTNGKMSLSFNNLSFT